MKYVLILSLITLATFVCGKPSCAGCEQEADLLEAEKVLNKSLNKLAAGDGLSYELIKVHSASKQVVSGSLYKIKADLKDTNKEIKSCDIEIWSQPWLPNGIRVTFECPGEEKLVKTHSD